MADPSDDVRIFSGDYSRDMWAAIREVTDPQANDALYLICCRLQEFEARFERLRQPQSGDGA